MSVNFGKVKVVSQHFLLYKHYKIRAAARSAAARILAFFSQYTGCSEKLNMLLSILLTLWRGSLVFNPIKGTYLFNPMRGGGVELFCGPWVDIWL